MPPVLFCHARKSCKIEHVHDVFKLIFHHRRARSARIHLRTMIDKRNCVLLLCSHEPSSWIGYTTPQCSHARRAHTSFNCGFTSYKTQKTPYAWVSLHHATFQSDRARRRAFAMPIERITVMTSVNTPSTRLCCHVFFLLVFTGSHLRLRRFSRSWTVVTYFSI